MMKKIYITLLIAMLPFAISAQTISVKDTLGVAFYLDLTVKPEATGNTITVNLQENAGAISDILNIEIYRNFKYNRLKDRVRIATSIPMPTSGTFIFVDDNETYTRNTSNSDDYGYDQSGAFPAGEPASYSISVIMATEGNPKFPSNRTAVAVYIPNFTTPDANVTDDINDGMSLWTRVYSNVSEEYAILAIGLRPSTTYPNSPYALFQDAIKARTGSDVINWSSYPIYGKARANEVEALDGRNALSDLFWFGNEDVIYHRIDKADINAEDIDASGKTHISFTFDRPNSTQPNVGLSYNSTVSVPVQITSGTASVDSEFLRSFSIYPNPSSNGLVTIKGDKLIKSYKVYNIMGKTILSKNNVNSKTASLNFAKNATGVYFAKIQTEVGIAARKIVIE